MITADGRRRWTYGLVEPESTASCWRTRRSASASSNAASEPILPRSHATCVTRGGVSRRATGGLTRAVPIVRSFHVAPRRSAAPRRRAGGATRRARSPSDCHVAASRQGGARGGAAKRASRRRRPGPTDSPRCRIAAASPRRRRQALSRATRRRRARRASSARAAAARRSAVSRHVAPSSCAALRWMARRAARVGARGGSRSALGRTIASPSRRAVFRAPPALARDVPKASHFRMGSRVEISQRGRDLGRSREIRISP